MASRFGTARTIARRLSSAAEALDKSATKGPKLPKGNDPSAFHSQVHAAGMLCRACSFDEISATHTSGANSMVQHKRFRLVLIFSQTM